MNVFFYSGVYTAAHDFKTEWVVVKGIKDFVDEMQANIWMIQSYSKIGLNFNAGIASCLNLVFLQG